MVATSASAINDTILAPLIVNKLHKQHRNYLLKIETYTQNLLFAIETSKQPSRNITPLKSRPYSKHQENIPRLAEHKLGLLDHLPHWENNRRSDRLTHLAELTFHLNLPTALKYSDRLIPVEQAFL